MDGEKMDKEEAKKKARIYYETHKEIVKEKARLKYNADKEKILPRRRELYNIDKENILARRREIYQLYYKNIKNQNPAAMAKYYQDNKKRINEVHRVYNKNKYHTDPQFRLKTLWRTRLRQAIFTGYGYKSIESLCGCSLADLRNHIESQFKEGMTLDNYGVWELDHIILVSTFDLTDIEQLKKCYHYTNLRPRWKTDNRNPTTMVPKPLDTPLSNGQPTPTALEKESNEAL